MMNNMFRYLFGNKKHTPDCHIITNGSPRANNPPNTRIVLWDHQLAMLQRCLDIEQYNVCEAKRNPNAGYMSVSITTNKSVRALMGIMNDPPGSGKTYVALALIATDRTPSTNMIIVPPNLVDQWEKAIKSFFSIPIKTAVARTYMDAMTVPLENTRIILTTALLAESLSSRIHDSSALDRVIIDEIDASASQFNSIPICTQVWFMSASFNVGTTKSIGPFDLKDMQESYIKALICRTDEQFMATSQHINYEEPSTDIRLVDDGEILLFRGVHDLKLLNALNFKKFKNEILVSREKQPTSLRELAELKRVELENDVENERFLCAKTGIEFEEDNSVPHQKLQCLKAHLSDPKICANSRDKLAELEKIVKGIKKEDKWIFFSDDSDLFDIVGDLLEFHDVGFKTLTGGTFDKNSVALKAYKEDPKIKVIMLNSVKDGCGLNLENTSNILFLHFTEPKLVEQVIGRAQRPGRTCRLNILCLYHRNELPPEAPVS